MPPIGDLAHVLDARRSFVEQMRIGLVNVERMRLDLERSLLPTRDLIASFKTSMMPVLESIARQRRELALRTSANIRALRLPQVDLPRIDFSHIEVLLNTEQKNARLGVADLFQSIPPRANASRVAELEARVAALEALLTPPEPPNGKEVDDPGPGTGQYL